MSADDLAVMRRIDELYLASPFYGSRRMTAVLRREGWAVNCKRVRRLMRVMALEAIYQKPNTSRKHPDHKVYPYLLRNLTIDRPNQVWCADITYIPMAKGFAYLIAVMDWFSRRILAWRVSITLEADFCVEALRDAMHRFGQPEIFNTDQGVQFTSAPFLTELETQGVRISMDGKGRFLDNIFIERLWRSLKYEEMFIKAVRLGARSTSGHRRAAACSTTTIGRTRRWTTGRHGLFSKTRPVIMWITLPLRSRVTHMITGTTATGRY